MGDFYKVLNQNEKKSDLPISFWPKRLRDFMDDSQALDLGSKGLPFTWTNKRKGKHNIKQRINRVLASVDWFHLFPSARLEIYKF